MINTHGLNINLDTLRSAAKRTANWPTGCGYSTEIYYDRETGEVWSSDVSDDRTVCHNDSAIITVCRTVHKQDAQWIADKIAEAVAICEEVGV